MSILALCMAVAAWLAPAHQSSAAEPAPAGLQGNLVSARPDDLWPQAETFPDPAKIELAWQGDGFTKIVGRAGAIPGRFPVMVVCPNSGAAEFARSGDDGGFEARLVALPGSWVIVKYDPTAPTFSGSRWLRPPFRELGSDVAMVLANAAPGTWLRVPPEAPASGPGPAFDVSGVSEPDGVDFSLTGRMTGRFEPGGSVTMEGTAAVFPSAASAAALIGQPVSIDAELERLFDESGRARAESGFYFSNILTPGGLPIQTKGRTRVSGPHLESDFLSAGRGGRLSAAFRWTLPLPDALPPGIYAFAVRARVEGGEARALKGLRGSRQGYLTRNLYALASFKVGKAPRPRLTWTLLTDVPGADGSRGVVAAQDQGDFELAGHVVTQSRSYIIPRVSKKDGKPLTYRLEPYLPMVSQGDRHVPNAPPISFRFPSGSLAVRVRRPDGKVDALGPAPFAAGYGRAPATRGAFPINGVSGGLIDVFQLTTASGLFDYRFPLYGRYEIDATGEVLDVNGNVYLGGGRYTVFVAEGLDLEPATLPMTPLQAGDSLNPGVVVLPGLPAEVDVSVTLFRESDPRRAERWSIRGRANRFGYFAQEAGARPVIMAGPGEFVVESTARYVDPDGVLWMGTSRWGQVVETPGAPVPAHGRRGRADQNLAASLWFDSPRKRDSGHMRYPFASGDVLWQTADDCLFPTITVQDREGLVEKRLRRALRDEPKVRDTYGKETGFEDRVRSGELPLALVSSGPLHPTADPSGIDLLGYFYAGAQRPGERVREVVSDDGGVGNYGYWVFNDPFGLQPGMGVDGDRPNDLKFLYGGAVFRDLRAGLSRYGIYGSLWVHLPDGDVRGTRVSPPFQGANGGPSGGPLMTIDGEEIDGLVIPLAVRPGTILETGDTFSFSAAIGPTLAAAVEVVVTGPRGFRRRIAGRANAVGYFYRADQDFVVRTPGLYRVSVTATFDSETSAGPMPPPFPIGSVLGAKRRSFKVYVVDRKSTRLGTSVPPWSAVQGLGPVALPVRTPGGKGGTLHYTIAMPGFQLQEGSLPINGGGATVSYDPVALSRTFPNIDVSRDRVDGPGGLVDTVWLSMMFEGADGRHHGRHFTLQGPDLHAH